MITIVIAGYAAIMLTIVVALCLAARRPTPKPSGLALADALPVRRATRVTMPTMSRSMTPIKGGTEVLAFGA